MHVPVFRLGMNSCDGDSSDVDASVSRPPCKAKHKTNKSTAEQWPNAKQQTQRTQTLHCDPHSKSNQGEKQEWYAFYKYHQGLININPKDCPTFQKEHKIIFTILMPGQCLL